MNALWLIGLLGLSASVPAAPAATEHSTIRTSFADLPLTFEINQGQTDRRVDFLARGEGYTLFLTGTEAVFALPWRDGTSVQPSDRKASIKTISAAPKLSRTVVRMQLIGSAPDPRVHGLDQLPGKVNYFRGDDASKWRANVLTFRKVRYSAVYPGVDLIYYGQPQQLEYDFIVSPGADPSTIKLGFAGVDAMTVDARGDLVLKTAGEPLRFQKPIIYQMQGKRRHPVEGGYVRSSPHEVGFRVGTYDRTRPLIIDPVLSYSTYLGGNSSDFGSGIVVDATGAMYVAGTTESTDFPTANARQSEYGGGFFDAFVMKLPSGGTALVYATYLGGNNQDSGIDIDVDGAGNAYITGLTSSPNFPIARALQATLKGERDAFVAKLSAEGSTLIYSTYVGGRDFDQGVAIAVDPTGAAYITGSTGSPDFPAKSAFQPVCIDDVNPVNAFVAKLSPDGASLLYSTYLGGSSFDRGEDIAVDSVGAAYVTGRTDSADFPTVNPIRPYRGPGGDAFVTKLAPDGKRLVYSTHLGGSDFDQGRGIAVDMSGAAYVTGEADSSDFPTVNALQAVSGGLSEGFVAKLPPEGSALIYATYLGGSGDDILRKIAVDTAGAAYVTGDTTSSDFPTMNPVQPAFGGGADAFVTKLAPDGVALVHSTYLGGRDNDGGSDIALDLTGAVYVTGATESADFPTVQPLQASAKGVDAFVAKLTDDSLALAPGNDIGSDGQSGDDSGSGSIDALLAALLAQLALARALRQRISGIRHSA